MTITRPFLALAVLVLTSCQREDSTGDHGTGAAIEDHEQVSGGSMAHAPGAGVAYSDVRFLDEMTSHHQMAIDMARAVGDRGANTEVRTMAQRVIEAQAAEIDTMRAWRSRWFTNEPATQPMSADHMAMMGMSMDVDALLAADGAELDRRFLMGMVPHHAGAVMMASHAQMSSSRPEIRRLAATIITDQAREIGEMQALLSAMPPAAPADVEAGAGSE